MQIQSTVTISNAYTKKKKNSKRVVNSLALLTNEAFQVMHMLQLHILCVLHWLGLLEPALYLVCMRLPGAPSSQEDLAISAGWIPKTYPHLVNKKKVEQSYLVQRQITQTYTFMSTLFFPSDWNCCIPTLSVGNSLRYAICWIFTYVAFPVGCCTRKILEKQITYKLQDVQTCMKTQNPKFT